MYRPITTALLIAGIVCHVSAQLEANHQMTTYVARRTVPIDLGGGNTFYACERAFGYDSSRVELMWTDPAHVVTNARSYRLAAPLSYVNTAAKLDDGFLVGGMNYGATSPFILKADSDGDVQWCEYLSNLTAGNDQVIQLIGYGSDFTAYTYPGGTYSDRLFKVNGFTDGSGFIGTQMQAPSGISFRMYGGRAAMGSELICGAGQNSADPGNMNAMAAMVNGSGVQWMNYYDMGGDGSIEDVWGTAPLADGNALLVGYQYQTSYAEGFIIKIDPTGAVIWAKRYVGPFGLFLTCAHELADGSILAAGQDAGYGGVLLKLTSTGDPVSQKHYASTLGSDGFRDFRVNDLGQLKLYGVVSELSLDTNGASCDLTDIAAVIASAYTPVVSPIAVANSLFLPTADPLATSSRTPEIAWTQTCVFNAIDEQAANEALVAWPIPTSGMLWLGAPGQVAAYERIFVFDITGKTLIDREYSEGIDLSSLAPGAYICAIPRTQQRMKVVKR